MRVTRIVPNTEMIAPMSTTRGQSPRTVDDVVQNTYAELWRLVIGVTPSGTRFEIIELDDCGRPAQ